ncbi:MAG: GIY-YIG nuclease family protein [bacterium]
MFIYLIQCLESGDYKIGKTKNIKRRLKSLQTGNSGELKVIDYFETKYPNKLEKFLHNRFSYGKKIGEWFSFSFREVSDFHNECERMEKNYDFLSKNTNTIDF